MSKFVSYMFAALLISASVHAENDRNSSSDNSYSPSNDDKDKDDSSIAQSDESPRSNSRWYKKRSGRQEYLQGGGSYPKNRSDWDDAEIQKSDPRWHKTPSGRQDYLQGGRGSQHRQNEGGVYSENNQSSQSPRSDPRWYKTPSGRQDYLQGGRGSQHQQGQ